jgi:hypothetical protein
MKHIKLFEGFTSGKSVVEVAREMVNEVSNDPTMKGYELELDESDPNCVFVKWVNLAESPSWRESGYAEDYSDDFSEVNPMNVLAVLEIRETICAYALLPEEKYYGRVILDTDDPEELENAEEQIFGIGGYEDFKRALIVSLWEMD